MRTKPAIQRDLLGAAVLHVRGSRAPSRSSLAAALGLAPSTVGLYVDQLIRDGYVNEFGLERGPVGRPKRTLATVAGAGWFAGVEFNAERVQAVRVDFSGNVVASHAKRLPDGAAAQDVLQTIRDVVALLAKNAREPLLALGVGAPGVVDPATGVSGRYSLISNWDRVPVAEILRQRCRTRVIVENNLRAIALAERWFGGGRHLKDYVVLGPRSGFAVAVVQDGRLLAGAHHAAGEIGHWTWAAADGREAELQDRLSASAVWRRLSGAGDRARPPSDLRVAFAELADEGDERWTEVAADFARVMGYLQLLVDTDVFFLHGPLTALGGNFCRAIELEMRRRFKALADAPFRIVPSKLGDDAGALGAASLAMEAWVPAGNTA